MGPINRHRSNSANHDSVPEWIRISIEINVDLSILCDPRLRRMF